MNISDEIVRLRQAVFDTFRSESYRQRYLAYIDNLAQKNLPPIISFSHLREILSVEAAFLRDLVFRSRYFYKDFSIPKRSGGFRIISAPFSELAMIQNWISENILSNTAGESPNQVIGYVKGKTILNHVSPHLDSPCLAKFDLKDFFPSITTAHVTRIFLSFGYTIKVARTLAGLVTKDGSLPQGACTSPQLSNIYLREFDERLVQFCDMHQLVFTRYADDIVVSGGDHMADLMDDIRKLFFSHGLTLNSEKTRFYRNKNDIRFVTGLIIQNGKYRLPKAMRRKIRAEAFGVTKALRHFAGDLTVGNYKSGLLEDPVFVERTLGKINYWSFIEPEDPYPIRLRATITSLLTKLQSSTNSMDAL